MPEYSKQQSQWTPQEISNYNEAGPLHTMLLHSGAKLLVIRQLDICRNRIITPQFSSLGRHSCCTCVLQVMCITNGALQTHFNSYTLPGWSKYLALQSETSQQSLSTCTALLRWSCAQIYKLCLIRVSLHHSHVITSGDSARASHQRTQNLFFASFIRPQGRRPLHQSHAHIFSQLS